LTAWQVLCTSVPTDIRAGIERQNVPASVVIMEIWAPI